jgi:hypothetical protein
MLGSEKVQNPNFEEGPKGKKKKTIQPWKRGPWQLSKSRAGRRASHSKT